MKNASEDWQQRANILHSLPSHSSLEWKRKRSRRRKKSPKEKNTGLLRRECLKEALC